MLSAIKRIAYQASTAYLRWHYRNIWGMQIGEGVRISRQAKLDTTNPKGVKIGDYTALAFGSTILTHDFVKGVHRDVDIGSHCLIGANVVVLPGVKIGDHCIVGPGSVVATDLPAYSAAIGNPARIVEKNITTGKWGIRNPKFLEAEGVSAFKAVEPARDFRHDLPRSIVGASSQSALLSSYLPEVTNLNVRFEDLKIDSFALITLRAEIEENEGILISDEDWTAIERPSDLLRFITKVKDQRFGEVVGATARRSYDVNMPQMALGGLSESWLFKEIGDLHWSLLTTSLGVRSRDIADQAGDRLYATFTRIRYRSTASLAEVEENDQLDVTAAMTRFGAGMFFSSSQLRSAKCEIEFEVMSSFSKFGESGENSSLVKGQPHLPSDFVVPSLSSLPAFATEYRERRAADPGPVLFETEYEILPQHDINGVGLLYFAAYPLISDICLMRWFGQGAALAWSPTSRDIGYFANSGASDRLIYRLHKDEQSDEQRRCVGTLSRLSDGKRMALIDVLFRKVGSSKDA